MSHLLCELYQMIGDRQTWPRCLKKGEKHDAANYRPFSQTCICCKTLEHIIVSNNKHLSLENILADCQNCFRIQRSCETQLVQFFHDMVSNLELRTGVTDKRMRSSWISLRPLTSYYIRDSFTNCTSTGLEDLLTSGSLHGSLSAIKKWC